MKLISPVRPYRGTRGVDAYGSGTFGASRDGGGRSHLGRDYIALPGDQVVSPIDGIVKRHAKAYPDADLAGLEIEGAAVRAKLLYVLPCVEPGERVKAGQVIGTAQDVASYHEKKSPRAGHMTNHVHLEVLVWIDPEEQMGRAA